jgi:hypothetical protein
MSPSVPKHEPRVEPQRTLIPWMSLTTRDMTTRAPSRASVFVDLEISVEMVSQTGPIVYNIYAHRERPAETQESSWWEKVIW